MTLPDFHSKSPSAPTPWVEAAYTNVEPALFAKCHRFFDPSGDYTQVKTAYLYPYFRPLERNEGSRAIINGQEVIMAGSNNYLGLTSDPRVKAAAIDAIERYGTGCTGSRFLNGTLDIHIELEEKLAEFMRRSEEHTSELQSRG